MKILEKQVNGKLVSENLVKTFQKLNAAIDLLLARVEIKIVADPQDVQSSQQNENLVKMLSLFENLFVGSDEG
jgi:hypothetical protein